MTLERRPWFLSKWISALTFPQKFLLLASLFGFSILITGYLMIENQNKAINFVEIELKGLRYAVPLKKLLNDSVQYYLLGDRYLAGETALKNDLLTLQAQISSELESLKQTPFNQAIYAKWGNLTKNFPALNLDFIEELRTSIDTLGDKTYLNFDPDYHSSYLVSMGLIKSGYIDLLIAKLTAEVYKMITQKKDSLSDKFELIALISLLQATLKEMDSDGDKIGSDFQGISAKPGYQNNIPISLNKFNSQLNEFMDYIDKLVIYSKELPKDAEQLITLSQKSLAVTHDFWINSKEELQIVLEGRLNSLKVQQQLSVLIAFASAFAGCVLGYWIMRQISTPLNNLVEATRRLTVGDLSARVPLVSKDEVGEVGVAFNQMADSFQELIGQLQWTGIQLTSSTTEIAATAKQQEATIVQQEATTKQIATTAHEISHSAREFAKTMSHISTMAEKTSSLAASGKAGLTKMESVMRQMVEAAGNIASKLAVLNEKAGSITSIITTISKVSDQTNLLSLNAAIEAEKAGEYGRSFSVIAREIRRLADQTANALLDIETMVHEMVSAVSAGVMGVDKFSEEIHTGVHQVSNVSGQLSEIIEQVQQQTVGFETVNQGMQDQSLGAKHINDSIHQLSQVAQQTTHSIRRFHNSIEQLNNAAQEMQTTVSKIKR